MQLPAEHPTEPFEPTEKPLSEGFLLKKRNEIKDFLEDSLGKHLLQQRNIWPLKAEGNGDVRRSRQTHVPRSGACM
jgi:hypothetical protein